MLYLKLIRMNSTSEKGSKNSIEDRELFDVEEITVKDYFCNVSYS